MLCLQFNEQNTVFLKRKFNLTIKVKLILFISMHFFVRRKQFYSRTREKYKQTNKIQAGLTVEKVFGIKKFKINIIEINKYYLFG